MSAEGSPTGAGRRINLLTIEKMVALAAMPRPIETMTASTKPGDLASRRNMYARSCRQAATMFSPLVATTWQRGPLFPCFWGKEVVDRFSGYPGPTVDSDSIHQIAD